MRLEHSIRIDAPPATVWQITEAIEAWPDWTPTISSVRSLEPGPVRRSSRFVVKQPLQKAAVWTVIDLVPGRPLAWQLALNGGTLRATHVVEPDGEGSLSALILDAPRASRVMAPMLRLALRIENRCLKRACERPAQDDRDAPGLAGSR